MALDIANARPAPGPCTAERRGTAASDGAAGARALTSVPPQFADSLLMTRTVLCLGASATIPLPSMVALRKRLLTVAWIALTTAVTAGARARPSSPAEPGADELAAARKLFAQALHDEEDGHYDVALARFRQVKEVRDTAPVEYRIGTCLESLGHLAGALAAYQAAVRLGQQPGTETDVTTESRERAARLSKRVGHLTLLLSSRAPKGAEVRVDGRPVADLADVPLDPGAHRVEATAPGVAPFQSDVTIPEGGQASFTLPLDPPAPAPLPPRPAESLVEEHAEARPSGSQTWGWIAVGTGGALLVASGVSLVLRENDIRKALQLCPGGGCVGAIDPEAQSATDRAHVEGPLALGLGIGGAVAAGVGVYLLFRSPAGASAWTLAPTVERSGAGFALRGAL